TAVAVTVAVTVTVTVAVAVAVAVTVAAAEAGTDRRGGSVREPPQHRADAIEQRELRGDVSDVAPAAGDAQLAGDLARAAQGVPIMLHAPRAGIADRLVD